MKKLRFLHEDISRYGSSTVIDEALVGTVSEDRSAVIGKDGWCFIYDGSNSYRESYLNPSLSRLGTQWADLINARERFISSSLGAKFLQVVVPNKLSILPERFPQHFPVKLGYVLESLLEEGRAPDILCPLEEFRDECSREFVFRRNDSHLTVAGNALLAELILDRLGLGSDYNLPVAHTRAAEHIGDLGGKFQPAIPEKLVIPDWKSGLLSEASVAKVEEVIPNGLVGIRQVFKNESAPINAKIVVFGNSFFERVPSWGLSPFFAATFREFHFVWTPTIDVTYLRTVQPDYVIGQTCERFLVKVPDLIV